MKLKGDLSNLSGSRADRRPSQRSDAEANTRASLAHACPLNLAGPPATLDRVEKASSPILTPDVSSGVLSLSLPLSLSLSLSLSPSVVSSDLEWKTHFTLLHA